MENIYPEKELHVGDFALFPKTVSASDVALFAGISGDMHPLYLNETFGRASGLGMRIVPPMLIAAMLGGAVYRLLSPMSCPVSRSFTAVKPMAVGDTLTARAEITALNTQTGRATVALAAYNSAGELVMEGISAENLNLGK